ncbi:hypothetical protein Pmani_023583 [Petrolisthes manimaculis]|uniref:DNA-directed RNA polymerase n=1 Tax=Petrolisthes manimaculis TaxID=1843537 RepID=A0AAE1U343_9EUCA|nr:hypothetical protein Pmani_023583 [Petrolisthes manimaculis]
MSERKTKKQLKRAWEWIRRKIKEDHAKYVKKINRTDGDSPPTPPQCDELQKIVKDIIPDLLLLPHKIFESSCVTQFLKNNEDDPQQNSEDCSINDGSLEETDDCSNHKSFSSNKVDHPVYKTSPIRLQHIRVRKPSTLLAASSKQLFGNKSQENYNYKSQSYSSSSLSEVEAGSCSSDTQDRYCQTSLKRKKRKGRKGTKRKVKIEKECTKKARVEPLKFKQQLTDKEVQVSQTGGSITNALGGIAAVLLKLSDGISKLSDGIQEMNNTLKEVRDKLVTIILEIPEKMSNHVLSVDQRHIMLLPDYMTSSAKFLGITRHGFANLKESTLKLTSVSLLTCFVVQDAA